MNIWKLTLTSTALALSTSGHAAIITIGDLVTDDTTNLITVTGENREYLRFDTFDLTYADTITATSTGGIYEGWSIATSQVADDFYASALGVASTPCTGAVATNTICGTVAGYANDVFGVSFASYADVFWFISTEITPGRPAQALGLGWFDVSGEIYDFDDWGSESGYDFSNVAGGSPINALLYRDVSTVPVPAAVWLFGSGLLGLIGVARRKQA